MAGHLRTPLLLLAALALTLALAVDLGPRASRKNGKSPMVGGLLDADVNEEGVQQALNFALSEYNKASNDAYHSRAMRVVRVRKQVRTPGCGGPGCGGGAALSSGRSRSHPQPDPYRSAQHLGGISFRAPRGWVGTADAPLLLSGRCPWSFWSPTACLTHACHRECLGHSWHTPSPPWPSSVFSNSILVRGSVVEVRAPCTSLAFAPSVWGS